MKREMELCRRSEEELVKKNYQFQKTIKMMNIKIKAQEMDSQDIKSLEDLSNKEGGGMDTSGDSPSTPHSHPSHW